MRYSLKLLVIVAVAGMMAVPAVADWTAGVDAYKQGDWATAEKEFAEVTKNSPEHPSGFQMLGYVQMRQGKTSQAVGNLRKAVELGSDDPTVRLQLGQGLAKMDEYGQAFDVLDELSLANVPSSQRTHFALLYATCARRTNRTREATEVLEAQVRADSSNADLHRALGSAYKAVGRDSKAFSEFERAWQLDPSDTTSGRLAVSAAIRVARRSASESTKDNYYRRASTIAEKLAQGDPTLDHLLLVGEAHMGADDYSTALRWFNRAQSEHPDNALAFFYKGQCYSSMRQTSNALRELQKALSLGPSGDLRTKIHNQMGYVYDLREQYDRAMSSYRNAGNSAKVVEMRQKQEKKEQNLKADAELREFKRRVRELEAKINEFEELGQAEEVEMLREQLRELKKVLAERQ